MYRSDKQFMKNPATANARIYIGCLSNTVVSDDLEKKFRQYGKILGLVLQKGFAFIQFENGMQAKAAINGENNASMYGKKIRVRPALQDKPTSGGNQNQYTNNSPAAPPAIPSLFSIPPLMQNIQSKPEEQPEDPPSPVIPEQPPPPEIQPELQVEDIKEEQMDESLDEVSADEGDKMLHEPIQERIEDKRPKDDKKFNKGNDHRDRMDNRMDYGDDRRDRMNDRGRKRSRPPPRMRDDRFSGHHDRDNFRENMPLPFEEPYPPYGALPSPVLDRPDRNDCEIIVVAKQLTNYAEFIEQKLKALGLVVDLLFPNEDVPIGRVLANISSRGCLYAILVMPQNEANKSLTLDVLHGIAQEHRNMPIEDALLFIARTFDSYMRGQKASTIVSGDKIKSLHDKHPHSIQLMLNILAENRHLTSVQYDKLLQYLEERRDLQQEYELSEGIEINADKPNDKQAELQNRIMNILNKTATPDNSLSEPPTPALSASVDEPPVLLKDPSVQKALDSLMLGDMFKNISSST